VGVEDGRAAPLEIRLFGGIAATRSGAEIDVGGPKQRMILALLALTPGRAVSLDRIIDTVWRDDPPARAEVSVRGYVSNLRRTLATAGVPIEIRWRELGYVLVGAIEVDVHAFERAVDDGRSELGTGANREAKAHFGRAVQLSHGRPFGAYATSLAADGVVARLTELRGAAFEGFLDARLALGEHREAVVDLHAAVAEYPYREHLRELLATALARSGRPIEALRSIDSARRELVEETGVDPGPGLRAVEALILAEDPGLVADARPIAGASPPTESAGSAPSTAHRVQSPFVGREDDLAALTSGLSDVVARPLRGSRGRAFVVSGEPGIGKSTLVERLADIARDRGCWVGTIHCSEAAADAPYWPWSPTATADAADVVQEIAAVLSELSDADPGVAGRTRLRTHARVVEILFAQTTPGLIVVDDLQWSDTATLTLLEHIAVELHRLPIALAVTVRADATQRDAVRDCLAEIARTEGSFRRELRGLPAEVVARWLELTLGAESTPELTPIVHARTGGNPFFVREVLALLESRHDDTPIAEAAARAIPGAVHDAVRRRTSRLDPATQRLLTVAAVVGREVDVDVLSHVAGMARDELLAGLEPAVDAGLVDIDPARPAIARFEHALIVDALAAELNPIRRARIHADITRALEVRWADDVDSALPQLTFHSFAGATAGTARPAVEYAVRAAEAASRAGSPADAMSHLEHALVAHELDAPGDARRRAELQLQLGIASCLAGDVINGRAALLDAALRADTSGWTSLAASALAAVNADDLWTSLDWGQYDSVTVGLIESTLDRLPAGADEPARASLLGALAGQLYHRDPVRASAVAAEAVEVADRTADPTLLYRVLLQQYWAEWRPSGNGLRASIAERMISLVATHRLPEHFTPLAHLARFTAAYELGDPETSDRHLSLAQASADPFRTPAAWSYVLYARASTELLRGRLDRAEATIEELYTALTRSRRFIADTTRAGLRLQLQVERGATDAALDEMNVLDDSIYASPVAWFRAWVLTEGGRLDEATAALDSFDGPLTDDWFTMPLLTAGITAAASCGHHDFVRRHVNSLEPMADMLACTGSGGIVIGPVALALASGYRVLGEDSKAERHLATARELIERMDATPWAERVDRRAARAGQ
jgi:DNA-binding SARP family transcriptional activator